MSVLNDGCRCDERYGSTRRKTYGVKRNATAGRVVCAHSLAPDTHATCILYKVTGLLCFQTLVTICGVVVIAV